MSEELQQIAKRLKELREIEEVSAEDLAREFRIPLDTYLAYESGENDIPISFLYDVANKFGVELTALLTGDNPRLTVYCHVKNGEAPVVERRKEYRYQNLAYNFSNKHSEAFLVSVDPKAKDVPIAENAHPGQEFNYLIEGRLQLVVGGKTIVLEPGDSIYFNSEYPHGMKALDGKVAKFVAVIMH